MLTAILWLFKNLVFCFLEKNFFCNGRDPPFFCNRHVLPMAVALSLSKGPSLPSSGCPEPVEGPSALPDFTPQSSPKARQGSLP